MKKNILENAGHGSLGHRIFCILRDKILNEEYEKAFELSKKAAIQQKDIRYIMCLYYRIICLEHLKKENELNNCVNEMLECIRRNKLSGVAVEEIINQVSFDKENVYKKIAAYGE